MALHKIVFDSSSAAGRAATHQIGAVLYDSVNDRLGLINASQELLVKDTDVATALAGTLTVSATDLDIRDLTHVSDSVKLGDGTTLFTGTTVAADHGLDVNVINASLSIDDGGGSITVDAVDLDIRDLTAASDSVDAWLSDGSGNAIGSTGGSLDVNVTNSIDVDDGIADTAISAIPETVGTTIGAIVDGADELANRKYLFVYNNDHRDAYLGQSGITTSTGFPIPPGAILEARIGPSVDVYMIGDKASMDIRTLQLS